MAHDVDMESRFYYFQGQTPTNTNISDRCHALHITGDSWSRINKHLDRKKLAREAVEKEERHKRYLDDGSKAMIKNWANSLQNIRKRKDEERAKALEDEKVERARKFHELRKEQEEIRKAFVDKANKNIFMNKGNAKQLTSAYIMGEVLYEREKQKEFKAFLMQHEAEEYAKEVEDVRRVAKEAAEEKKTEIANAKRKSREIGEIMRRELAEKEQKQKKEAEKQRIMSEREYNEAQNEMDCMKQKDLEMKMKKKEGMRLEMQKLLENDRQKKMLMVTEDQELDEVVRAYKDVKDRIDCKRKAREKALRQEAIQTRMQMAEKAKAVSTGVIEEAKREQALQRAIKEREEMEAQRELEKIALHKQEVLDKIEGRRQFMLKEEERLKKEAELRKWEMVNRYKTLEAINKFDKDSKIEHRNKIQKYRTELLEQIEENKVNRKKDEEIEKLITQAMIKTDDDKFFAYADEILDQERKTGRPTYPTEKAIVGYKKNCNIPLPPNEDVRCVPYKPPHERDALDIVKQSAQEDRDKRRCKCRQRK